MYRYLDAVVVRATAWRPGWDAGPWPDLTGAADSVSWSPWLRQIMQIPGFAAALEQASPALASRVREICDGRELTERAARRVVLSVMRYLLRASGRATPFGLFAGVAPARIAAQVAARVGGVHRVKSKVDAGWLTSVIEHLEAEPALRPRLTVLANNLVFERDGYLVLEHCPGNSAGDAPRHVRVRATPPVHAAMRLAHDPIQLRDLAVKLATDFPGVPAGVVDGLLSGLLAQRLLLTNLRPGMTTSAPLSYLLAQLHEMGAKDIAEVAGTVKSLRGIADELARHDNAPTLTAASAQRERITAAMDAVRPTAGKDVAVDLRVDWDLTVPYAVAAEAADAATMLVRLAGRRSLNPGWDAWHGRFLERYGPHALVPVLDAVNADVGLGYPAGYTGGAPRRAGGPLTDRDKKLLALAQNAALRHQREVVLDEALVAQLAGAAGEAPVQPTTELTVRIHASSVKSLDSGDFTLTVLGVSRTAGTTTGRFLTLFDDEDRDRMAAVYANRPTVAPSALAVQLSAPPRYAGTENVARSPQVMALVLPVGEYTNVGVDARIALEDIAVTADARRVYLLSLSQRRPVEPLEFNAVEPVNHTHPLVRFLAEAPSAMSVPCTAFDWGAAAGLPFLPALRYRRTVLSPARWLLTTADLPGPEALWPAWDDALTAWREEVALPHRIYLGEGDQRIPLDMAEPAHRALLRAHVDRAGTAALRAAGDSEAAAWIGGRVHEIVVPLAATGQLRATSPWREAPTAAREHGHLPGCDGRFSLKLYGHPDRQNDILTRHLPQLLNELGDDTRWWFLRYHDPDDHLRLRLRVPTNAFATTATAIGAWSQRLRTAGLIACVQWDTYFPETARFGGGAAMAAAEAYFAADSAAALAQLAAVEEGTGPDLHTALTAASLLDIAIGLIGDSAEAMGWLIEHTRAEASPPARALYDQALALAKPDDHSALVAHTGGRRIVSRWAQRRQTLAAYRSALQEAGETRAVRLLPDLLHLHHVRMAGTGLEGEAACLHLARAAAVSWTARAKRGS